MKLKYINVKNVKKTIKENKPGAQIESAALVALDKKVEAIILEVLVRHQNNSRISATEIELSHIRG